jgi:hypothetical protein
MNAVAWADFPTRHWNRAPARLRQDAAIDVASAYAAIVTAAEPFRAGVRAGALPDVRLQMADGLLRAPGDLLPGEADPTPDAYASRLGGQQFVLTVEQPLLLDFALWARVRALVAPLWRIVGTPTVPVVTELVLGRGAPTQHGNGDGALIWVLSGDLELDAGGDVLSGAPGDVVYVPPGHRYDLRYGSGCLLLRLRISGDSRLVVAAVKDLAAAWLQRRRGPSSVPWLPYPPPRDDGGALPVIDLLAETSDAVATFGASPELARLLRTTWAKRVSAGALEPAPRPREPIDLRPGQRVRANHAIVRMPDDDGWICAVNGYAFLARHTAVDVLARLHTGEPTTVEDLCAGHGQEAVLALLQRLYTLRGVDVITEN